MLLDIYGICRIQIVLSACQNDLVDTVRSPNRNLLRMLVKAY